MTRRRLTAAERRQELLAAAMHVFGERGYHGASIDDIASQAGVSKALIYEHFASKRELHDELLEEHAGELFRRFEESAARGQTGEERLRGGVDAFFSFVEDHREAWRVLFRDAADPDLEPVIGLLQAQATRAIVALTASDPTNPGGADAETVEMYAQLTSGACQALANWWQDHPEVPRGELVDRVVEFCWIGMDRVRRGERADRHA
ncbi:MAG: TetR/AcrR family transcriptional regulator [Solirubrobacterales bacterium]|nr:TetR/AcrR family transcriptional regulator [Solirubrobacterales bacterium]